jgi:hypothetical protein
MKTIFFSNHRLQEQLVTMSRQVQNNTPAPLPKTTYTSPPAPAPPPSVTTRIQIQRSSSSSDDDSNGSEEIVTEKSRQRRKKSTSSNERSNILKQIKHKTQEKKKSVSPIITPTPTIIDRNNNAIVRTIKSGS